MMKNIVRGLGVGWLLVAAASCVGMEDSASDTDTGVDTSGEDIQAALSALPSSHVDDVDDAGIPTFISGDLGHISQVTADGTPDIQPLLLQIGNVFRANSAELVLKNVHTDAQGDNHFRYTQVKNGLPVLGGELVFHVRQSVVIAANGSARADIPAPAKAAVSKTQAVSAAKAASSQVLGVAADANPRLAYRVNGAKLDLVYIVKVTGAQKDGTPVVDDVLVNAVNNSIVDRISYIHTARNREVHNLSNGTSLPGATARTETGTASSDAIVNSNFTLLGTVYDGYKALFNRDSYDNKGAKLLSSVHYSKNYNNAYWNGTQMVYGDGDGTVLSNLANSLDVTAHELTHAVTERTSNLQYSGQSGGLNEAMSDILGNTIEWYSDGKPTPANARNFLVGDDVYTPNTPGDALRYMCDPAKDGRSLDYAPNFTNQDVHYSSGIPNLAFCLLAQSVGKTSTHPRGKTTNAVPGIGFEKAAQIFYKADTSIWTSTTNFASARTGTEQAAKQLGYSQAEIDAVSSAWAAVGVGSPPSGGGTGGGGTGGTGGGTGGSGVLTNGTAVTVSGAKSSKTYYTLAVPAGATSLTFKTSGGTGNLDLYVKSGSQPTTSSYECKSAGILGTNSETCTMKSVTAGTYYVMLSGSKAYSNASLVGTYK